MEKIHINNVEPAKRKDGSNVEGISKNGRHWKLFKINNKYSYFDGEECDLEIGKEYNCEVETKQDGKFTNYTINKADLIQVGLEEDRMPDQTGDKIVLDKLQEISDKIDKLTVLLKTVSGEE